MEKPLRTAFITGCSSGIGRAAARLMAAEGLQVVATARRPETIEDLLAEAQERGHSLITLPCDVTDEGSCVAAVMAAREAFGDIHILVNNAGYGLAGPIEAVPLERARTQFEVNTFGAMRLVRLIVPDMRRAGWGRIVNVSSILGKMAAPFNGWYSASKFALEALSDALRLELARSGIQTVSILPGPVKTAFVENVELPDLPMPLVPVYESTLTRMRREHAGRRKYEVSAEHCARVILRAVQSSRPRPRYYVTFPARFGTCSRRFLSDRMVDAMMAKFYGLRKNESAAGKAESR
ncbi:SDR family oxidoreductase [bacterium]|nr:SDR family oxidoreductase [bacterium]MBU1983723.1 SDR family oxidoreductase [bacterium]